MDDFERAIICAFDPSIPTNTKQSAQNYLQQLTQNVQTTWKLCLDKIVKNSSRPEVIFWCFQTLTSIFTNAQSFQSLTPMEVQTLQQTLLLYIREVCAKDANLPVFIKNKYCECLVMLYRATYLDRWNDFWRSIFQLLSNGGNTVEEKERIVDIYLRIMDEIDAKIVSRLMDRSQLEHEHNVKIKDKMRDDCIPDVVNTWFTILSSQHKALTKNCLKTMQNYIDWIDINLVIGDRFMKMIFSYVSVPEFRNEACDCLSVIVNKGMFPMDKLKLLVGLQLPSIKNMNINSEEDEEFASKISQLSNAIGLQLVDCWDQLSNTHQDFAQQAYTTLQEFLPFIFKLFADKDDEVSSNVTEFMSAYISQLKKKQKIFALSDTEHAELRGMMQVVRNKAKYTEDFIFDPLKQDEYERGFMEYRRELFVVFKNATRIAPNISKQYVETELSQVLNVYRASNTALPFWDLEVVLSMFYQLGEIFPKEATDPTLDSGYFKNMLSEIVSSGVSFYPHESVQLAYFEIIGRYGNLLTALQQFIIPVLESFMDSRGIRNPKGAVHSRATFLFKKLVESLQPHLHAFVEKLYEFMQDFLKVELNNERDLLGESKLFLYEALGSILAHEKVSPQVRVSILERMLQPIIPRMEEVLSKQLYKTDTAEKPVFSKLLAEQIGVIGTLCKGLSTHKRPLKETTDIFKHVLSIVVNVSNTMPENPIVSKKVIFYMHVMITVLNEEAVEVFPSILTQLINAAPDIPSLEDVLVLFNQLMTKKQAAMFNFANEMFLPLVGKMFTAIDNAKYDQTSVSEETRLKTGLHKMYFTVIYTLLTSNLGNVLTSPKNSSQFEQVLETIIQGCEHRSPHIIRICFNCLQQIVKIWGGSLQGFDKFVYNRITPICFSVPLKSEFELSDGTYDAMLGEILAVPRLIVSKYHTDYINYLTSQFLPQAFGLSLQEATIVASQLQSGNMATHINASDNREMKKFFRNFFASKKALINKQL